MVQQESAGTLSSSHNHAARPPTDQAWIAAQNWQTHTWLHQPAHQRIRQPIAQQLAQLRALLPQADTRPAPMRTNPTGTWRASAITVDGSECQAWQLWENKAGDWQPQERLASVYPTGLAWRPDGSGFYYDHYLAYPGVHALYFHRVGTAQCHDRCICYHAEQPTWYYQPTVSPDGRWLAITVLNHSANNRLILVPLCNNPAVAEGTSLEIVPHFSGRYDILHWLPDRLILRTIEPDAPNGRLLVVDLQTDVGVRYPVSLAQQRLSLVDAISFGAGWVVHHLRGGCSELHCYDEQGRAQTNVPLPGRGTVLWLAATDEPPQLCYGYTDHVRPPQSYRWQPGQTIARPDGEPLSWPYAPNDFCTRQVWISSADGTRVPLFLTQRRGLLSSPCPTLLTAYGGLGQPYTPHFTVDAMVWLLFGGRYATVCTRGGSELGAAWHQAAVGLHKQRTFDDLLAAARWLVAEEITTPAQLGLWGISNGGLTAGACLTQAPHAFGAVVIESGLLDMLDYPQLGSGSTWLAEYGSPTNPTMRQALAAYSPLHKLQPGQPYPPTLITTHECDPRVGVEHSLRFAHTLQAAQGGTAPICLRVEPGSGHGDSAEPTAQLAAALDRLTFLAVHLGLQP